MVSLTGFTLIEAVMVMVIIGILAAVALPAFVASYDTLKLEGARKQLMQDIRYAQQIAVARHTNHGIVFNPLSTAEMYSVYRQSTSTIVKDPATQKPLTVTYISDKFSGIDLVSVASSVSSAEMVTLEFNYLGVPSTPSSEDAVITLSYSGQTKTITVKGNTGSVQ